MQDPAYRDNRNAKYRTWYATKSESDPEWHEDIKQKAVIRRQDWVQRKDKEDPFWREAENAAKRDSRIKRLYGLTPDQVRAMYDEQEGKCAICKTWHERLDIDHNHETGEVRSLLCGPCNRKLGVVERMAFVVDCIEYLEMHKIGYPV
jgi:hypothetical protein